MKQMPVHKLKAHCLHVIEEIETHRTPVVITKRGRAVAKLVPVIDVFGGMAGTAKIVGDIEAPVFATDAWEAFRRKS